MDDGLALRYQMMGEVIYGAHNPSSQAHRRDTLYSHESIVSNISIVTSPDYHRQDVCT